MKRHIAAAKEFIANCGFSEDISAVFLAGSYAAGNADEYSDIDLYMVLDDGVDWRERGNRLVDGLLIEYFANPMRQIQKYVDSECETVNITTINMILNGVVIFDKNETAKHLREYCLQKDLHNFPKLSEFQLKTGLYGIWHCFDELTRAHNDKTADFDMQYYILLKTAFEFYSRYICSPIPNYTHLYKWLTNRVYRDKFNLPSYKDPAFLDLTLRAFDEMDAGAKLNQASRLKDYIFNKAGGFDINNFTLKSQC
jgi:hypothetical protein